jgi:hypothetical protein
MNIKQAAAALFYVSAAYDGLLGLFFLIAPDFPYNAFNVPPPNHFGYVQFPAGLLIVFSFMFANIARDPQGKRDLIPYGVGLKVSYCSVTGMYWLMGQLPGMWQPFFICDAIMGILYLLAYRALAPRKNS